MASKKQYKLIGRCMNGTEVSRYVVTDESGKKIPLTKEAVTYFIDHKAIVNMGQQLYKGDIVFKGVGCKITDLPIMKIKPKTPVAKQ